MSATLRVGLFAGELVRERERTETCTGVHWSGPWSDSQAVGSVGLGHFVNSWCVILSQCGVYLLFPNS